MQGNPYPSGPFDPSGKIYSQEIPPPMRQPYPAHPYPPAQQPYPPPSYNAYQQPQFPPSYSVPPAQPAPVYVTVRNNDGCWKVFWVVLVISVVLIGSCGCAFFTIGGSAMLGAIGLHNLSNAT